MKPSGVELRDARLLGYETAMREAYESLGRAMGRIPPKQHHAYTAVLPVLQALKVKACQAAAEAIGRESNLKARICDPLGIRPGGSLNHEGIHALTGIVRGLIDEACLIERERCARVAETMPPGAAPVDIADEIRREPI